MKYDYTNDFELKLTPGHQLEESYCVVQLWSAHIVGICEKGGLEDNIYLWAQYHKCNQRRIVVT